MNNLKTIAIIGSLIVVGKYCYDEYKRRKAEFKEYKDNKLSGRDLDAEVDAASIDDADLDSELKVSFKKVLNAKATYIRTATNTKSLDDAVESFDKLISSVKGKEGDAKIAAIKFCVSEWEDALKRKAEEKARQDRIDEINTIGSELINVLQNAGFGTKAGINSNGKPYIVKDPVSGSLKWYDEKHSCFWTI